MTLTTIEAEQEMQQLSSLFDTDKQLQQARVAVEGKRRRRRKKTKDAGEGKKRRLTDKQVQFLEMSFVKERKLESGRKDRLAAELGLDPKQVAVWFQNRRARWKNKQLEGEFMKLKTAYDTTVVDKCHLENEVLSLKGRLLEAEEEIRKLIGREKSGGSPSSFVSTGNDDCLRLLEAEEEIRKLTGREKSSGSPSSFVSTGNDDCLRLLEAEEEIRKLTGGEKSSSSPTSFVSTGNDDCLTFFGELGMEGEAELMYMPEYNYISYMMDLGNLYGM